MHEQDQPDFTNGLPSPVLKIEEGQATIEMPGEWDLYNSRWAEETIGQQLRDSDVESIVVDLRNCAFMDAIVLGVFIDIAKQGEELRKPVSFINASRSIAELFAVTGLDKVFSVEREPEPGEKTAEPNWHVAFALSDGPHSPSEAAARVASDSQARIFLKTGV